MCGILGHGVVWAYLELKGAVTPTLLGRGSPQMHHRLEFFLHFPWAGDRGRGLPTSRRAWFSWGLWWTQIPSFTDLGEGHAHAANHALRVVSSIVRYSKVVAVLSNMQILALHIAIPTILNTYLPNYAEFRDSNSEAPSPF